MNCGIDLPRGAAVVPEVSFKSEGLFSPQSAAMSGVRSGMICGELLVGTFSFAEALADEADITAVARQISKAASRCCAPMDWSSGRTTNCLRRQAMKIAGQSSWLPICTATTAPGRAGPIWVRNHVRALQHHESCGRSCQRHRKRQPHRLCARWSPAMRAAVGRRVSSLAKAGGREYIPRSI